MDTHATIQVNVHQTPNVIYDVLARAFGEWENNGTRGVSLRDDRGRVTFFASNGDQPEVEE